MTFRDSSFKDLVGDVQSRTSVNRFLQNQVVVFLFGDFLDDLVRALQDRGEFFIFAKIQLFAKLALQSLALAR